MGCQWHWNFSTPGEKIETRQTESEGTEDMRERREIKRGEDQEREDKERKHGDN